MKKILITLTLGILLTGCSTHTTAKTQTETEFEPSYYPLLMQVTDIKNGIVTAEDSYGTLWSFTKENANVNELYSCIMYDNGTEEVEDDEIIKMRFSGEIFDYISESIVDYNATETGILFNFDDGSGYYLELTSETN